MKTNRPFTVLFVCSGNSCRSPMAEALMRVKLPSRLEDEVEIKSAGTLGIDGMLAADHAISVVEEMGGVLTEHLSQGVTRELVENSDLILGMAREHIDFLQREYPAYRENIFLLKKFAQDKKVAAPEIDDPIGFGKSVYRECANIIAEELDRIMPAVTKMVQERRRE